MTSWACFYVLYRCPLLVQTGAVLWRTKFAGTVKIYFVIKIKAKRTGFNCVVLDWRNSCQRVVDDVRQVKDDLAVVRAQVWP